MIVVLFLYIVGGLLLLTTIVSGITKLLGPALKARREKQQQLNAATQRYMQLSSGHERSVNSYLCYLCSKPIDKKLDLHDPTHMGWIHVECYNGIFQ